VRRSSGPVRSARRMNSSGRISPSSGCVASGRGASTFPPPGDCSTLLLRLVMTDQLIALDRGLECPGEQEAAKLSFDALGRLAGTRRCMRCTSQHIGVLEKRGRHPHPCWNFGTIPRLTPMFGCLSSRANGRLNDSITFSAVRAAPNSSVRGRIANSSPPSRAIVSPLRRCARTWIGCSLQH